ncbi:energy-coupling factor ABC transporter permease [Clostridium sp.]|uniref:energy-coupling factor ABC transporter permease n=1 Tax=Clostridium sp. TaxID=1506 RepID=UPI003463CF82
MKKILYVIFVMALAMTIPHNAYAMHIAEGFLPLKWSLFYGVLALPFLYLSIRDIKRSTRSNKELKMLLALMAAYVFMMSAMKLPSVTGSSSHPTGTGLGAIVFGPTVMGAISLIVLLFQSLLLAHGGLTTLGANVLSMGIVGPFVAYFVYRLFKKKNIRIAVFLGAALGDLVTYIVTSLQLALAFPSGSGGILESFISFGGLFAVTQIPLAIVEGIISVIIYDFVTKHCSDELLSLKEGL